MMDIAYVNWEYVPILLIVIVGIVFIVKWMKKSNKDTERLLLEIDKKRKQNYKEKEGLEYLKTEYGIKYLGGFKDLGKKDNDITIVFFKDRIRLTFDNNNYRDIMQKSILGCKIQNQTQIRQQISMGKIVLLGVFALAGNNTKEINKEFALLDCYYEGDRISIVLDIDFQLSLEQFVRDINRLKNINENTILSDFKPYCE
ncbi:hypothetical protein P5E90_12385 [Clostridium perfringens]|nr:hypothetical protein [Clostridium perfringens]